MTVIESKNLREAAKGQACTVNIMGVCNYRPETSVMAHVDSPFKGYKSSDLAGIVIACSDCHDAIDGRNVSDEYLLDKHFYILRAVQRTLHVLFDMDLIYIKGES